MAALESSTLSSRRAWSVVLRERESWLSIAKWGAITGFGYVIFANLMNALVNLLTGGTGNLTQNLVFALPICGSFFALFFALYTAGNQAARERTHVAPGVLSSVLMLVIAQVVGHFFMVSLGGAQPKTTTTLGTALVSLVLGLALTLGVGYMGAFYGVKNKLKAMAQTR